MPIVPLTGDLCGWQILGAFAEDDSLFMRNCSRLMAQSRTMVTMPQYEFRNICDAKLESICRRMQCYQQVCVAALAL